MQRTIRFASRLALRNRTTQSLLILGLAACAWQAPDAHAQCTCTSVPQLVTTIGQTGMQHATTRGHNQKLIFYPANQRYYGMFLDKEGNLCTGKPQANRSQVGSPTGWSATPFTMPGAGLSSGGSSGFDYDINIDPTLYPVGQIVALENEYDTTNPPRAFQVLHAYNVLPAGGLVSNSSLITVGDRPTGRAGRGYGSLVQDATGRFWVAQRDENGDITTTAQGTPCAEGTPPRVCNDIVMLRTTSPSALAFPTPGAIAECSGTMSDACHPFPLEATSVVPSGLQMMERAVTSISTIDAALHSWLVFVAYIPAPGGDKTKAGVYLRAYSTSSETWNVEPSGSNAVALVPAGSLRFNTNGTEAPGEASRPAAAATDDGTVLVAYVPNNGTPEVDVITIKPPYHSADVKQVSIAIDSATFGSTNPTSVQLRIDRRFTPNKAYVVALSKSQSAQQAQVRVAGTPDTSVDPPTWTALGVCSLGSGATYERYQSIAPALDNVQSRLLTYTSRVPTSGSCTPGNAVEVIDLSCFKY